MFGRLGPVMPKAPTLAKPKIAKPRKPHVPKMPSEHQQSLAGPYQALLDPPAPEATAPATDASGAT